MFETHFLPPTVYFCGSPHYMTSPVFTSTFFCHQKSITMRKAQVYTGYMRMQWSGCLRVQTSGLQSISFCIRVTVSDHLVWRWWGKSDPADPGYSPWWYFHMLAQTTQVIHFGQDAKVNVLPPLLHNIPHCIDWTQRCRQYWQGKLITSKVNKPPSVIECHWKTMEIAVQNVSRLFNTDQPYASPWGNAGLYPIFISQQWNSIQRPTACLRRVLRGNTHFLIWHLLPSRPAHDPALWVIARYICFPNDL